MVLHVWPMRTSGLELQLLVNTMYDEKWSEYMCYVSGRFFCVIVNPEWVNNYPRTQKKQTTFNSSLI